MSLSIEEFDRALAQLRTQNSDAVPWRKFPKLYIGSLLLGLWQRHLFANLETFCLFVGVGRSGTTLLANLLNAHPQVVISTELDATLFMRRGFGKHQILALILRNAEQFARSGSEWTQYSYAIPDQWQGRSSNIKVIGDKKASKTTLALAQLCTLESVQKTFRLPLKLIQVVRNPYDNISTLTTRNTKRLGIDIITRDHLRVVIKHYFQQMVLLSGVIQDRDDVIRVSLETLIRDPRQTLINLCGNLNVDAPDDYIDACAAKLFSKPKRTVNKVPWDSELISLVQEQSQSFGFLAEYHYDEEA